MSDRERWIIYPLLFFAIMLGVTDRMERSGIFEDWTGPAKFFKVHCRQLVIEDVSGEPAAICSQNEFGEIQLSLLDEGAPAVVLSSGEGGGRLLLIRETDQQAIFLGHNREHKFSGFAGVDMHDGRIVKPNGESGMTPVLPWPADAEESEQATAD